MFSSARLKDGIENLEISQKTDVVFAGEPGNELGLMFRHSARKIVCHADIQRPIPLTRKNVDEARRIHAHCISNAVYLERQNKTAAKNVGNSTISAPAMGKTLKSNASQLQPA